MRSSDYDRRRRRANTRAPNQVRSDSATEDVSKSGMKRTIRTLGWRFNANRMVMDYFLSCYVAAAGLMVRRGADALVRGRPLVGHFTATASRKRRAN